jgi:hypothetical protein
MLRRLAAAVLALGALLAVAPAVEAASPSPSPSAASPSPTPDPYAGQPWWVPVGLRGQRLTAVAEGNDRIEVTTAGGSVLASTDGGSTFTAVASATLPPRSPDVHAGADEWLIRSGTVLHASGGGAPAPDPGAPDLGAGAHLIAAPLSAPGVVVAVSDAGAVWRRSAAGVWERALILLPQSLISWVPSITDVAAFTAAPPGGGTPASIYLATDGYAVLATQNGGFDWFRDGPGLPGNVLGLAAAPDLSAVLAATDDGLWVHHLRVLPGVPQYPAPDLSARQRWIAAITLASCLGGGIGLWLLMQMRPRRRSPETA